MGAQIDKLTADNKQLKEKPIIERVPEKSGTINNTNEKAVEKVVYKDRVVDRVVDRPVEKIVYKDRVVDRPVPGPERQVQVPFEVNKNLKKIK